jgi:hypothetical protein
MDGFGDRSVINKLHKLGTHEWNLAIWLHNHHACPKPLATIYHFLEFK